VLSRFQSIDGPRWVWTTFSPDQIDLNYHNPEVLLSAAETLLFYVRAGADLIRLDAVTYFWKELGTSSASLEQAHQIVKLFRDVLDLCSPQVILVTESNVPHEENISYFGNGHDEAQLVYNFALPPLVLHAFYRESSRWRSEWASGLQYPSPTTNYLNILDTHDGVGLSGVQSILPDEERSFLVQEARQHGAFISNRTAAWRGSIRDQHNLVQRTEPGEQRRAQGAAGAAFCSLEKHRAGAQRSAGGVPALTGRQSQRLAVGAADPGEAGCEQDAAGLRNPHEEPGASGLEVEPAVHNPGPAADDSRAACGIPSQRRTKGAIAGR
jgi:hypothetical protein